VCVKIKCQLDATDELLLQVLLLAQHVSGTIMPIIRSSRVLYKWFLRVVFGAWFSSCQCSVELRVVCPICGLLLCSSSSVAPSWHFISTYYRRCTVKTTSNTKFYLFLWNESYCLRFKGDKLHFTAKNYILFSVCVCVPCYEIFTS
jgi:hypothetical protein